MFRQNYTPWKLGD